MIEGLLGYEGPEDVFNLSTGIGHSQMEILEMFRKNGKNVIVNSGRMSGKYTENGATRFRINTKTDVLRLFPLSGIMILPARDLCSFPVHEKPLAAFNF